MQSIVSRYVPMYQNTALHVAAREGHVAAVNLLLSRGAELTLNKNNTSFLHEALQNERKDVVNALIDSDRCVIETPKNLLAGAFFVVHWVSLCKNYHLVTSPQIV